MAENSTLASVLELTERWRGQREAVADVYNRFLPHPRGYAVKYTDPLCATYVSALFIALEKTELVPPECSAEQLRRNMASLGRYLPRSGALPQVGDLIFFDFQPDGWCDHVGIVTAVKGSSLTYSHIPSSTVTVNTVSTGDGGIMGYGRPDYGAAPVPAGEESVRVGAYVRIRPGAVWFDGGDVPDWVTAREWLVTELLGQRAVLGRDREGQHDIRSPIRVSDLTHSVPAPEEEWITVTVTLPRAVFDRYGSAEKIKEALT